VGNSPVEGALGLELREELARAGEEGPLPRELLLGFLQRTAGLDCMPNEV
jgi:hypothetical protein